MLPDDVLRRVTTFYPAGFACVDREGRSKARAARLQRSRDRLFAAFQPPARCMLCDGVVEPMRYLSIYCIDCLWQNAGWSHVAQLAPETRILSHP